MKTVLYDIHQSLGAKLVEFCGWEMPIMYQGIIQEHRAVRERAGVFDVCHMGRINIEGEEAESLLDYLSTNVIKGKPVGSATYTVWSDIQGKCVDDLIVYRESATKFFVIVNAGNREKDLKHLQKYAANYKVKITDRYREEGILAVQGPKATEILARIFPEVLQTQYMHFISTKYKGLSLILSHTGYTGAGGFEIYAPLELIRELWERILQEGKSEGIEPVGLGARDTLRLEKGFALYGHEINDEIAPTESVSAWTVKWHKHDFLGKAALEELEKKSTKRHEYGAILTDKGIAREGYPVYKDGVLIGKVTSGTLSPSLNLAIAIVLVERKFEDGDSVDIQIRQNLCRATITKLPFLK